ncbi:MAG TPA: SurA N-terminal domain-containing protein, partial [Alphaproteobacteria bacterium]|nr:SurA N-terminal domain-containing protein [Alphaproteobacteria bacterium]
MLLHYMRKGAKTGLIRYTLFGLLLLAAGGMVFMDVGGFFRRGVQSGDVARVGREGIGLSAFDRMLRAVLSQQGIGPQDAWRFGIVQQVLGMEIRETLVARAAADMGLRVSDAAVAARIAEFVKPMARDGATPQQALDRLLQMQGMSEA